MPRRRRSRRRRRWIIHASNWKSSSRTAQPSGKDFFVRQSNLVISGEVSEDTDASGDINGAEGVLSLGTPTVTLYRDANGNGSYDDGAETLVGTDDARTVAAATVTLAELLADTPGWEPPNLAGTQVIAQPHCHHHAVMGWDTDAALLTTPLTTPSVTNLVGIPVDHHAAQLGGFVDLGAVGSDDDNLFGADTRSDEGLHRGTTLDAETDDDCVVFHKTPPSGDAQGLAATLGQCFDGCAHQDAEEHEPQRPIEVCRAYELV